MLMSSSGLTMPGTDEGRRRGRGAGGRGAEQRERTCARGRHHQPALLPHSTAARLRGPHGAAQASRYPRRCHWSALRSAGPRRAGAAARAARQGSSLPRARSSAQRLSPAAPRPRLPAGPPTTAGPAGARRQSGGRAGRCPPPGRRSRPSGRRRTSAAQREKVGKWQWSVRRGCSGVVRQVASGSSKVGGSLALPHLNGIGIQTELFESGSSRRGAEKRAIDVQEDCEGFGGHLVCTKHNL